MGWIEAILIGALSGMLSLRLFKTWWKAYLFILLFNILIHGIHYTLIK